MFKIMTVMPVQCRPMRILGYFKVGVSQPESSRPWPKTRTMKTKEDRLINDDMICVLFKLTHTPTHTLRIQWQVCYRGVEMPKMVDCCELRGV